MAPIKQSRKVPTDHIPGQGYSIAAKTRKGITSDAKGGRRIDSLFLGTPVGANGAEFEELPDGRTRSGQMFREMDNIMIPVNALPVTLVLQLSRAFVDDENDNARSLCFGLAEKVEEFNLLKGHSSTFIAAACIYFAGLALQHDLFTESTVDALRKSSGAMRTAYNELWLSRTRFVDLLHQHGGKVTNLPKPYAVRGGVDHKVVRRDNKGLGGGPPIFVSSRAEKRNKRGVKGKRSGLATVYETDVSDTKASSNDGCTFEDGGTLLTFLSTMDAMRRSIIPKCPGLCGSFGKHAGNGQAHVKQRNSRETMAKVTIGLSHDNQCTLRVVNAMPIDSGRKRRRKSLRKLIGHASVEKAEDDANGVPTADENNRKRVRVSPRTPRFPGKGTPMRAKSVGQLELPEPSRTRSGKPFSQIEGARLPLDLLPVAAVLQMSRLFTNPEDGNVRALCHALVGYVEEHDLMKGYSSTVIAAACIYFASAAVRHPTFGGAGASLLSERFGAVMSAYNQLWLRRFDLEALVEEHGGYAWRSPLPLKKPGVVDVATLMRDGVARGMSVAGIESWIQPYVNKNGMIVDVATFVRLEVARLKATPGLRPAKAVGRRSLLAAVELISAEISDTPVISR